MTDEQREAIRARLETWEGILSLKRDMPLMEIKRRQIAWSKISPSAPWDDISALLAEVDRLRDEVNELTVRYENACDDAKYHD